MARKPAPKPEPIPAIYRRGGFRASDPKAFAHAPRKPEPEPTPEDRYDATRTAIYLGIAVLLIAIAVLLVSQP